MTVRIYETRIFESPETANLAVSTFDDGYVVISDTVAPENNVVLPREQVVKLRDWLNAHLEGTE